MIESDARRRLEGRSASAKTVDRLRSSPQKKIRRKPRLSNASRM